MVHVVFDRPIGHLKAYDEHGKLIFGPIDAAGDAWGEGGTPPYGSGFAMPPGHYMLTTVEHFDPAIASEGFGQIYVADLDGEHVEMLVQANKAEHAGDDVTIGGITLPIGQLATFGRSEIMIHGGGSNLGMPAALDDFQDLLKTFGCTRIHNADWRELAANVANWRIGNTVVYSAIGAPLKLAG